MEPRPGPARPLQPRDDRQVHPEALAVVGGYRGKTRTAAAGIAGLECSAIVCGASFENEEHEMYYLSIC